MASGVTISWICTGGALVETGVVSGVPGTPPPGIGIPVPGLIAGAPGIPPPGIIPGTPPGTALVGAMPGTPPGTIPGTAGIVPTPPGIAPGTMVGGVLVAMPGTALVAPGIPGTPAHTPCSRERNAVLQNRVFFMSGLSLACCNHRSLHILPQNCCFSSQNGFILLDQSSLSASFGYLPMAYKCWSLFR